MKRKRYNYHEHFEMLMVRHDYLSKIKDPDPAWVKKWEPIVKRTSYLVYTSKINTFSKVSYYLDDIESIANCYMMSYMELYSIERNEKEKAKFLASFQDKKGRLPTTEEIYLKERTKLISFLRQKLQHASVVCSRKSRNVAISTDKSGIYAETKDTKRTTKQQVMEDHKKYGYRSVTKKEFKEIKKKAQEEGHKNYKDSKGFAVMKIDTYGNSVILVDDAIIQDKAQGCESYDPENIMIAQEDKNEVDSFVRRFKKMKNIEKKNCLNKFVSKNKGNSKLKNELKIANKMLKELRAMV